MGIPAPPFKLGGNMLKKFFTIWDEEGEYNGNPVIWFYILVIMMLLPILLDVICMIGVMYMDYAAYILFEFETFEWFKNLLRLGGVK